MSKGVQIALAVASVFVGVVIVLTLATQGSATMRYYGDVSEFTSADAANRGTKDVRVHGFVVPGSIAKDLPAGHVDFHVADKSGAHTLPVRYLGIDVPDMFKDKSEVVIEGRLDGERFAATKLMAKCPSKYEAQAEKNAAESGAPASPGI